MHVIGPHAAKPYSLLPPPTQLFASQVLKYDQIQPNRTSCSYHRIHKCATRIGGGWRGEPAIHGNASIFTLKVPVTFPSIYHVFERFAPYRVPFFVQQSNVVANICLQALLIVHHYQQCVAKYLHQGITNCLRTRAQGANL